MLPNVTGNKLCSKNDLTVNVESCSGVRPEAATIDGVIFANKPFGIKNIFAILCS